MGIADTEVEWDINDKSTGTWERIKEAHDRYIEKHENLGSKLTFVGILIENGDTTRNYELHSTELGDKIENTNMS